MKCVPQGLGPTVFSRKAETPASSLFSTFGAPAQGDRAGAKEQYREQ